MELLHVNEMKNWSSLGTQTKAGHAQDDEGRAATHIPCARLSCALPAQLGIQWISLDSF